MKVVLTGGPSGGKTTLAQTIQKELTPETRVVPEAASMIFAGGFPRRVTPDTRRYQQRAIYWVQRELEGLYEMENPNSLLICDRGSLDGLAYWPEEPADFLRSLETTLDSELERYQWVIHLDTANKTYYDTNNPVRIESFEQAMDLNRRVRDAWAQHPQHFVITNSEHFMAKVDLAMDIIRCILRGMSYHEIRSEMKGIPYLEL